MKVKEFQNKLDSTKFPDPPLAAAPEMAAGSGMSYLAAEFAWRRKLNLHLDEASLIKKAQDLGEKAVAAKVTPTQINRLLHLAASALTWSDIVNHLLRQMSKLKIEKSDNESVKEKKRKQKAFKEELKAYLADLKEEAESYDEFIIFDESHVFNVCYQKKLRNQEGALILFRGFLERLGGFYAYFESTRKGEV